MWRRDRNRLLRLPRYDRNVFLGCCRAYGDHHLDDDEHVAHGDHHHRARPG
jgi:hypothetical protein